jgi:hypothetical protein
MKADLSASALSSSSRRGASDQYLAALGRELSGLSEEVRVLERRQAELSKKTGLLLLMFGEPVDEEAEGGERITDIIRFLMETNRLLSLSE